MATAKRRRWLSLGATLRGDRWGRQKNYPK